MRAFQPVHSVEWVQRLEKAPAFAQRNPHSAKRMSQARRNGLSYEKKVKDFLQKRFGEACLLGQWFEFSCNGGDKRVCQIDAAILHPASKTLVIVESKLRHCALAWLQLQHLYKPVCQEAFPEWDIRLLEVCRWYEPLGSFPVEVQMQPSVELIPPPLKMGVFIFAPNRT